LLLVAPSAVRAVTQPRTQRRRSRPLPSVCDSSATTAAPGLSAPTFREPASLPSVSRHFFRQRKRRPDAGSTSATGADASTSSFAACRTRLLRLDGEAGGVGASAGTKGFRPLPDGDAGEEVATALTALTYACRGTWARVTIGHLRHFAERGARGNQTMRSRGRRR
jgi:hypothetical protein